MRTRKIMSMVLVLCILLMQIGTIGVVNAAEVTETVNVVMGGAYTLPATVNEQAVTWSPSSVDTSKLGYKYYTGTLADSSTVTYKVNVGEKVELAKADFENVDVATQGKTALNDFDASNGILKFYKPAYDAANQKAIQVATVDGNNVWQLGERDSVAQAGANVNNLMLFKGEIGTPGKTITYKVKLDNIDIARSRSDFGTVVCYGGAELFCFNVYGKQNAEGEWVLYSPSYFQVYYYSADGNATASIADVVTPTVVNGKLSTGWFTVEIEPLTGDKYNLRVNGKTVAENKAFKLKNTNKGLELRYRTSEGNNGGGAIYVDDFALSEVRYVADDLSSKNITTSLTKGDASAQQTTVELSMTDGSAKEFTVNYTADTSEAGEKTAQGTIDGFDDTVTVSYTVVAPTTTTVNTVVGETVTLADGSTVIPESVGQLKRRVSAEGAIYDYTINVGEKVELAKADFENVDVATQGKTALSNFDASNGILKFYKPAYDAANQKAIQVATVDGNNVWQLGERDSVAQAGANVNNLMLFQGNCGTPGKTITYKVKLDNINIAQSRSDFGTVVCRGGAELFCFNVYGKQNAEGEWVLYSPSHFQVYYYSADGNATASIADVVTPTVVNGKLSTDWITIEIEPLTGDKYNLRVNGKTVVENKAFKSGNTNQGLEFRFRTSEGNLGGGAIYIDDFALGGTRYVADGWETTAVKATVPKGAAAEQTTTATFTMTDGRTKDFVVSYTADTSREGTGYTTTGTISGFDTPVTVTYDVTTPLQQEISTFVGNTLTFIDGSTHTCTSVGRFTKTVTYNNLKYIYRVNVGEYIEKVSDNMNAHTATTYTYSDTGATIDTIAPADNDGIKLFVTQGTDASERNSAVISGTTDKQIKFDAGKVTRVGHLKWQIVDRFEGDSRVSIKVRAEVPEGTSTWGDYIRLYDTNGEGTQITHGIAARFIGKNFYLTYINDGYNASDPNCLARPSGINGSQTWGVDTTTANGITSAEVEISFDIHKDTKTYDIWVNGNSASTYKNIPFVYESANGDIGSVRITRRNSTAMTTYYDDLKVYSFNCFEGDLPTDAEVTVGVGASSPQSVVVPLTLSNGTVRDFNATVEVDASKIAKGISATATIEGFDEPMNVKVNVANYVVETIGYKKGNEFVGGPVNGGSIASVAIKNYSGAAGGERMFFAWYNSDGEFADVKFITLPVIEKGATETIDVGLTLPDVVDGGMLKIITLNNFTNLSAVDFAVEVKEAEVAPVMYTVGDSHMCNYGMDEWPKAGIGQVIDNYLDVEVNNNYAYSGRTAETFYEEGYWGSIYNKLKPGDYVLMSLGANDQDDCETLHPDPADCAYVYYMDLMMKEAKEKCANVIVYSDVRRNHQYNVDTYPDPYGTTLTGYEDHEHYKKLPEICAANGASYIDMTKISGEMLMALSSDAERAKYCLADLRENYSYSLYAARPEWENSYHRTHYQAAIADTSHFTIYGANKFARRIADEIKKLDIILSNYVNDVAAPAHPAFEY